MSVGQTSVESLQLGYNVPSEFHRQHKAEIIWSWEQMEPEWYKIRRTGDWGCWYAFRVQVVTRKIKFGTKTVQRHEKGNFRFSVRLTLNISYTWKISYLCFINNFRVYVGYQQHATDWYCGQPYLQLRSSRYILICGILTCYLLCFPCDL
jgi:hypothetical protein